MKTKPHQRRKERMKEIHDCIEECRSVRHPDGLPQWLHDVEFLLKQLKIRDGELIAAVERQNFWKQRYKSIHGSVKQFERIKRIIDGRDPAPKGT
jgi:hypothetical protein